MLADCFVAPLSVVDSSVVDVPTVSEVLVLLIVELLPDGQGTVADAVQGFV